MRKLYFIAALAMATLTASAQQVLNLSTQMGTQLDRYDGRECQVNVNRYLFTGWNTIALPFSMSQEQVNETFGNDCRLEQLVGAEEQSGIVTLYFQECKSGGIQANTPYILRYSGENGYCRIKTTTTVAKAEAALCFPVKGSTDLVTMAGAANHINQPGLYGVLAIDNGDARFVAVDETKSGFYATRCFIQLASGNSKQLITRHLAAGETTSIDAALGNCDARADVYTLSGIRVATNATAADINRLQPGVYVINGQKIAVKR